MARSIFISDRNIGDMALIIPGLFFSFSPSIWKAEQFLIMASSPWGIWLTSFDLCRVRLPPSPISGFVPQRIIEQNKYLSMSVFMACGSVLHWMQSVWLCAAQDKRCHGWHWTSMECDGDEWPVFVINFPQPMGGTHCDPPAPSPHTHTHTQAPLCRPPEARLAVGWELRAESWPLLAITQGNSCIEEEGGGVVNGR